MSWSSTIPTLVTQLRGAITKARQQIDNGELEIVLPSSLWNPEIQRSNRVFLSSETWRVINQLVCRVVGVLSISLPRSISDTRKNLFAFVENVENQAMGERV